MKSLPYLEEIYDFETEQLDALLAQLNTLLIEGGSNPSLELPEGFESYEKFERKALKLKDALELELEERSQVDNVISFFVSKSQGGVDLLNDDDFYKPKEGVQ